MNRQLAAKKQRLTERARIVQSIRAFFISQDYLEVETPLRLPANAPELYIDAVVSGDWDLQTSPELAMKRLLAAGYEKIFQISHCWRDQERGGRHLPEFTMLEWYRAGCNYLALMDECESLLRHLIPTDSFKYLNHEIELSLPFERISVNEAFQRYCRTEAEKALAEDRFDELMAFEIEPQLGKQRPTILYDYPVELAALSRHKSSQPNLAERFELYIGGMELANAFSELTDPVEQRRRFVETEAARRKSGKRPRPMPETFLKELDQLPESGGIALGIDRLIMLMTNAKTIDEVIFFAPEDL
jgi:lysyl-tRNA synthetase class 2